MAIEGRVSTTIGALLKRDGGSVKTGPFGTTLKAKEYSKDGVPLISVGEVGYGSLRVHETTPRAPREVVERLPEYLLEAGDIVFGRKGAVDRSAMVKPEQAGWFLGSDGIRLRLPNTCDTRFIAYQLQSSGTRSWLLQHATGTTMASLNQGTIERVPIALPPLPEQRAIAHILGTLDDKIELNRRMNETLEAIARALFKSWFVDFDPVRAKSEGRDPSLPSHLADLFADSFEDSELGEIPKGWRVSSVGLELATLLGGTPSRTESTYWEGGAIPWINSGKANEFRITEPSEFITAEGMARSATKLLPERTTIVAITGATLGQVSLLEIEACANQSVVGVLGSRTLPGEFVYFWIRERIEDLVSRQTGGAQQHVNKNDVDGLAILMPSRQVVSAFQGIAGPIFDRIKISCLETRTLAALRDALLPKLISGELRVKHPEWLLEAAT